mgnify:CR=1 FL=1
MNIDSSTRRRRMAAFTLAPAHRLADGLDRIGPRPEYGFLRRPETGLVMVRGRIGGSGRAFNLGEMLVTRCTVQCLGRLGHGWVPGRSAFQAEMAALGDALGQLPEHAQAIAQLVEELEAEKRRRDENRQGEVLKTRVKFFTLVRGADKND